MSGASRLWFLATTLCVTACVAQAQGRDLDVVAPDGARLKATYYSPSKPGPAVVLFHQCDMDRHAWDALARALVARGVHVLLPEYRGFWSDKVNTADYSKMPADLDAALAALGSQPGVDSRRVAAGGASCGVDHAVQLAQRSGQIKALVLMSGPTSDEGLSYIRTSNIPVFLAFSADEAGPLPRMKLGVAKSGNPATTIREFMHAGHGVPMFTTQPTLLPELTDWLVKVLG